MFENGKVVFYKDDQVILEEMTEYAFDSFYRTDRDNGDRSFKAYVIFKPDKKEHFFGLEQVDYLVIGGRKGA